MPAGVEPPGVKFEPEWIVPLAMTVTLLLTVLKLAWLWAFIPLEPPLMTSPAEVVTLTLPTSFLSNA